ncbi:MAG: Na+/H+ antiporter NhaA [Hyphomicrobium aestuarii]|nr:Na+/H+ antiporter NhaA [Hyphomicrobium aestuarii]
MSKTASPGPKTAGSDPQGTIPLEVIASLILFAAAIAALIAANSPIAAPFKSFWELPFTIGLGDFAITDSLKLWIKNGLMAIFFLHVGLEIKNEFMEGALSDRKRAILPLVAAVGGIAVPALIYLVMVGADRDLVRGWAIPTATDIAFAIGVVGLLGSRVPPALKAFLLAVAVIDDLAAITIIAVFYSGAIQLAPLGIAVAATIGLMVLSSVRVTLIAPYLAVGLLLWIALYYSGLSPTLAGVITAAFVPMGDGQGGSPLHRLEGLLRRPVLFVIMPIFALANAGVAFSGTASVTSVLAYSVALALIIGKPAGILLAVALATWTGLAAMPRDTGWRQMAGAGALAGIGFTMSLFVGYLAFGDGPAMDQVRLGVLTGSAISALIGAALLWPRAESRPSARSA